MTTSNPLRTIQLYTDGACSGNPGPGGWAYILRDGPTGREREASGGERDSTNNRMELMGVIEGLSALTRRCRVELYSDSKYVLDGLQTWIKGWKKNNWVRKTSKGREPVKNVELWQKLDELASKHEMHYHYVAGHSGHIENERCDVLAVAAAAQVR